MRLRAKAAAARLGVPLSALKKANLALAEHLVRLLRLE